MSEFRRVVSRGSLLGGVNPSAEPACEWPARRALVLLFLPWLRVSLAAGVLQKKKLIQYTRGAVKIVNRKKLEDSACECYGITQQYNGELGLK